MQTPERVVLDRSGVRRYRLTVQYDGSDYAGWQVQPGRTTVQQTIERVLSDINGAPVKVHASGRTDQGVHAMGQVAHVDLKAALPPAALKKGLNALLPPDIRVVRVQQAPQSFHARRQAKSKDYRYFIWNGPVLPPFLQRYRLHVRTRLDIRAMNAAAEDLRGKHDFAAFMANPNREIGCTIRHLRALRVIRRGREVVIVAQCDGFLYKMMRSLCGLLIRVGEGGVPPSLAKEILATKIRTARVPTAPPQGLFLWKVHY
jgi:tRNA pseudouridine38-40 synthase